MIAAIVLAAGESKRMGDQNKLLLPFRGQPLIAHVVQTVRASDAEEVIVVLGYDADRVRDVLEDDDVIFVHNPRFREGMTTSIHAGVWAAAPDTTGFMICLSDLPLIEPEELNALIAAFEKAHRADERSIVVPVFQGQQGNPVLFSAHYKPDLLAHRGLMGCKGVIKQHREQVVEVAMDRDHVLRDVDTPEAYHHLRQEAERRSEGKE